MILSWVVHAPGLKDSFGNGVYGSGATADEALSRLKERLQEIQLETEETLRKIDAAVIEA